ncbi:hypothetical protein AAHH62_04015 [Enterococcus faecium]
MLERDGNMLNLLSKKLQRQLNLLEILFEEERCRLSQLEKDWQVLEKHCGTIL